MWFTESEVLNIEKSGEQDWERSSEWLNTNPENKKAQLHTQNLRKLKQQRSIISEVLDIT